MRTRRRLVFTSVSCSASPPRLWMRQRLFFPDRLLVNAIHSPSGDHEGLVADLSPWVNWRGRDPSASATQMRVTYSLRSSSMSGSFTVNTTRRPSGEGTTPPTARTFICSSGVQPPAAAAWAAAWAGKAVSSMSAASHRTAGGGRFGRERFG
jgi:hypothetical protein